MAALRLLRPAAVLSPDPGDVNECLLHLVGACIPLGARSAVDTRALRRREDRCCMGTEQRGPEGAGNRGSGAVRAGPAPPLHAAGDPAPAVRATGLRLRPRAPPARSSASATSTGPRSTGPWPSSNRTASSQVTPEQHAGRPGAPGLLGHGTGRAGAPGLDGGHPGGARPPRRRHPPLPGDGHDRRRAGRGRGGWMPELGPGLVVGVDDLHVAPAPCSGSDEDADDEHAGARRRRQGSTGRPEAARTRLAPPRRRRATVGREPVMVASSSTRSAPPSSSMRVRRSGPSASAPSASRDRSTRGSGRRRA